MKKTLLVTTAVLMAVAAQAEFIVDIGASFGFYNKDGVSGILPSIGDTATVELLYVGADGVINYENGSNGILQGGSGDDVLLGTFSVANNGGAFEDFAFFDPVTVTALGGNGQVFGRIWWDQDSSAGGAWYYEGHLALADAKDPGAVPPPTPTPYILGQGLDSQVANMGQVIPEPATFGLMGVAGLGLFLARKKARS